jgi:uncharacterized protein (DUF342 family)
LAAEGQKAQPGQNADIDYKVKINKGNIIFGEDDQGNVDFRNLQLVENVTAGQVLAVKIPADRGVIGISVTNKTTPVKPGKDIQMKFGKGVMISNDGMELTAAINGQVVFKKNILSIEDLHVVPGDVGPQTGNINFLGSVIINGSVLDNYSVKASGNIEVKGTVQKAFLESEADIIIGQGISGRNEAVIESTNGSIFAKFIQNANVMAAYNVFSPEGILHSNVDAGGKIISLGKRAKIIGGVYRAANEVNVKFIGGEGGTQTEVWVGVSPKILNKQNSVEKEGEKLRIDLDGITKDISSMNTLKRTKKFAEEKETQLQELVDQQISINEQIEENKKEMEEIHNVIEGLDNIGKICVERKITVGVSIFIRGSCKKIDIEFNNVKFIQSFQKQKMKNIRTGKYEEMYTIKVENYEEPQFDKVSQKMANLTGVGGSGKK